MPRLMHRLLALALALGMQQVAGAAPVAAEAPVRSTSGVEAEIARLAGRAGGVVGVAAWRLDGSGPRVLINAGQHFPMASTFKVAVAGAIMAKIDGGELSLDQMVPIDPDTVVESEGIAETFVHPGASLSVYNLLELMLTVSDNTAADMLTGLAGGPAPVTAWVRSQGIDGVRVDRDTAGLIRDFFHLPAGPFPEALAAGVKADPGLEGRSLSPNPEFDKDPRDTATPTGMAKLLERIFSGKALSPASTKVLTAIMQRNTTGKARIRGRLPEATVVAEKTGTIGGSVNDVGMITLPGSAGQVILAVFVKQSARPYETREAAIADIGRAIYDYYLFEPGR